MFSRQKNNNNEYSYFNELFITKISTGILLLRTILDKTLKKFSKLFAPLSLLFSNFMIMPIFHNWFMQEVDEIEWALKQVIVFYRM